MSAKFRYYVWDPWLLIMQMIAIQSMFYFSISILAALTAHAVAGPPSMEIIFTEEVLDTWQVYVMFLIQAPISAYIIFKVSQRAKQVVDFATTMFLLHLLFCILYDGVPRRWTWWGAHILCTGIAASIAETLCIRAEMAEDIQVDQGAALPSPSKTRA